MTTSALLAPFIFLLCPLTIVTCSINVSLEYFGQQRQNHKSSTTTWIPQSVVKFDEYKQLPSGKACLKGMNLTAKELEILKTLKAKDAKALDHLRLVIHDQVLLAQTAPTKELLTSVYEQIFGLTKTDHFVLYLKFMEMYLFPIVHCTRKFATHNVKTQLRVIKVSLSPLIHGLFDYVTQIAEAFTSKTFTDNFTVCNPFQLGSDHVLVMYEFYHKPQPIQEILYLLVRRETQNSSGAELQRIEDELVGRAKVLQMKPLIGFSFFIYKLQAPSSIPVLSVKIELSLRYPLNSNCPYPSVLMFRRDCAEAIKPTRIYPKYLEDLDECEIKLSPAALQSAPIFKLTKELLVLVLRKYNGEFHEFRLTCKYYHGLPFVPSKQPMSIKLAALLSWLHIPHGLLPQFIVSAAASVHLNPQIKLFPACDLLSRYLLHAHLSNLQPIFSKCLQENFLDDYHFNIFLMKSWEDIRPVIKQISDMYSKYWDRNQGLLSVTHTRTASRAQIKSKDPLHTAT